MAFQAVSKKSGNSPREANKTFFSGGERNWDANETTCDARRSEIAKQNFFFWYLHGTVWAVGQDPGPPAVATWLLLLLLLSLVVVVDGGVGRRALLRMVMVMCSRLTFVEGNAQNASTGTAWTKGQLHVLRLLLLLPSYNDVLGHKVRATLTVLGRKEEKKRSFSSLEATCFISERKNTAGILSGRMEVTKGTLSPHFTTIFLSAKPPAKLIENSAKKKHAGKVAFSLFVLA